MAKPAQEADLNHHLVSQAQQGDHDAFSVLMSERIPKLYRIAGLITGRHDIAEDAVQDALMHAWRDLPRLRDVERFDAWMHRLLVNACQDQGRRQRRQRAETPLGDEEHPGMSTDAGQMLAQRDELERAFRRLNAKDRGVIVLRHYLGLSTAETATAMGMREGTLKSRLHRAMKLMAAAMAAESRASEITTKGRPA